MNKWDMKASAIEPLAGGMKAMVELACRMDIPRETLVAIMSAEQEVRGLQTRYRNAATNEAT